MGWDVVVADLCSKEAIWKGPEHAQVTDVKISDEAEVADYEYPDFEVIRKKKT